MVGRPAPFKKVDVQRAVAGVRAAGLEVGRVEIFEGRIIIHAAGAAESPADEAAAAFDEWSARHAR